MDSTEMKIAQRIRDLRTGKGVSQEALADETGVSRQAVSKWESGQSMPDVDNILLMSEYFGVATDYLLKGTTPEENVKGNEAGSKICYIVSTAFFSIGLFCAFSGWYEKQTMASIWGGMVIQAVGAAVYFIGRVLSAAKAPFAVRWLNIVLALFMPASMLAGAVSIAVFAQGWVAPYPTGLWQTGIFTAVYLTVCAVSFWGLKKRQK